LLENFEKYCGPHKLPTRVTDTLLYLLEFHAKSAKKVIAAEFAITIFNRVLYMDTI